VVLSGWIKVCLCEPDAAIERVTRAMRLSPHDPFSFDMQSTMAFAHFTAGRHIEGLSWAEADVRRQANFSPALRILAASNAMIGRKDQARNAASRLLDLNPEFRISDVWSLIPMRRPEYFASYQEGLRLAGLPE
jgi:tetratricopeptide (TPR) repeat protein